MDCYGLGDCMFVRNHKKGGWLGENERESRANWIVLVTGWSCVADVLLFGAAYHDWAIRYGNRDGD